MAERTPKERMLSSELYHAFTPELIAERERCAVATHAFNTADRNITRVQRINLWNDILQKPHIPDDTPDAVLDELPWVEAPFHCDYGYNIHLGDNVFINFHCVVLDTCSVTIGARCLLGPDVSFYAGTHPLDGALRNGTKGPEMGAPIVVEEDCWIGGKATFLPGVTIGKGSTIGASAVVTKSVPPYSVVVGNPGRVVKTLKPGEGGADYWRKKTAESETSQDLKAEKKKPRGVEELLKRVGELEKELAQVKDEIKTHVAP